MLGRFDRQAPKHARLSCFLQRTQEEFREMCRWGSEGGSQSHLVGCSCFSLAVLCPAFSRTSCQQRSILAGPLDHIVLPEGGLILVAARGLPRQTVF